MNKRPTLIGVDNSNKTSLQLAVNSERQLKEIRTQTKTELAIIRYNLRAFVPVEMLEALAGADYREVGFVLDIFPTSSFRISVAEKQDGKRTPGILHLIDGMHQPYLQKGLADSCYATYVDKFKAYARFDARRGREGWWCYNVPTRVKGSFVYIGGKDV